MVYNTSNITLQEQFPDISKAHLLYRIISLIIFSLAIVFAIISTITFYISIQKTSQKCISLNFRQMNLVNIFFSLIAAIFFYCFQLNTLYCQLPQILVQLLFALPFIFCLGSYYIVLELWILLLGKAINLKFNYKRYFIFVLVLIIPSMTLFVVGQLMDANYVLIHFIFMGYFAVLVVIVNVASSVYSIRIIRKVKAISSDTVKKFNSVKNKVKWIIGAKMFIAGTFVIAVIIVIITDIIKIPIGWLIYDIVVHSCYLMAIVLELIIFHIDRISSKKKKSPKQQDTKNIVTNRRDTK